MIDYASMEEYKEEIKRLVDLICDVKILCRVYTIVLRYVDKRHQGLQSKGKKVNMWQSN